MPLPPRTTRAPSSWPSAMYFSTRSCWRCATIGPISVAGSSGSPTCMPRTVSASASTTVVVVARGEARIRVCATQAWPVFISAVNFRPSMVAARSASSRTIAADLPPSSSETRLSCSPQTAAILRPAAVEPVKATLSTPGWAHEVLADLAAGGDDVDDAAGHAGLLEQLGHQVGVERGLRRRLDARWCSRRADAGIELGHDRELRDVPRRDRRDDADRLAAHDDLAERPGAGLLPRERASDGEERLDLHPRAPAPGRGWRRTAASPSRSRSARPSRPSCRRTGSRSSGRPRCAPRGSSAATGRSRRRAGPRRPRRRCRRRVPSGTVAMTCSECGETTWMVSPVAGAAQSPSMKNVLRSRLMTSPPVAG